MVAVARSLDPEPHLSWPNQLVPSITIESREYNRITPKLFMLEGAERNLNIPLRNLPCYFVLVAKLQEVGSSVFG